MKDSPRMRWIVLGLLFLSTVINYIDRQTLSILARTIQDDLRMSDLEYAGVVQMFLLAYTIAYLFAGRVTDLLGTRWSMALFILWWSAANMLTGLARSAASLGIYRFLLGVGEPGNYTAAPKAVSEWFPARERGLAVGIYTAGATIGATIAPPLIAFLGTAYGWRAAFVFTGILGFLWVIPWILIYRTPAHAARNTPADVQAGVQADVQPEFSRWKELLHRRETWLLVLSRLLTDPVWYFYLFWFPKYLSDVRGLSLVEVGSLAWLVYLAADFGSVGGGWLSGRFIKRGFRPVPSRIRVMTLAAAVMPLGIVIAGTSTLWVVLLIASIAAAAHLTWQVTLTALAVDLYPAAKIATVFGIIAAGSGLGGLLSTRAVGYLVTEYSYVPVFLAMGVLHPIALLLIYRIRENPETKGGDSQLVESRPL